MTAAHIVIASLRSNPEILTIKALQKHVVGTVIHGLQQCFQDKKSPIPEEQLEYFVEFLEMGWEDVAIAYFNFCIHGSVEVSFT